MFAMWGRGTDRSGAALVIVAILMLVLSIFVSAAVTYLVSLLNADTDSARRVRVFYVAEAARAHATSQVKAGVSSHMSEMIVLQDNQGTCSGEYSYTITDITLPDQDQRRRVQVHAYWPDGTTAVVEHHATFYMEQIGGSWVVVSYMRSP